MRQAPKVTRAFALVVVPLLFVIGFSLVFAQQYIQPDGRLNQLAHFGGDAFYCVDDDNRGPTTQFPEIGAIGFRLLNKDGQELWYVPAENVAFVLANVILGEAAKLIATGTGSYGETTISVEVQTDGRRFFTFTGYDEHGKTNSLRFEDCTPVGGLIPPTSVEPTATLAASLMPVSGPTATPSATATAGPSPTASDTLTATNTSTATDTLTATNTSTATDTLTATNTSTATDTATPTQTPTATDTQLPT